MSRVVNATGSAIGTVFGAVARLRGTKPLHPRGSVHPAELVRRGTTEPWGVPWLDDPGTDRGIVRLSRSIGLPEGWPDILGLAFRFTDEAGPFGARSFTLHVASPLGSWQQFGVLTVGADEGDPPVDLDAVRNHLPGLPMSPVLAALREPSYAPARAHRRDSVSAV